MKLQACEVWHAEQHSTQALYLGPLLFLPSEVFVLQIVVPWLSSLTPELPEPCEA